MSNTVGKVKIANYSTYNFNMALSLDDKLYFLDKVDFDVIVDFGCADGILLEKVSKLKPNVKLIGYDLDSQELEICARRVPNAFLTSKWSDIIKEISSYEKPLLNLSSVIHEVYSYTHPKLINNFWENVFNSNFKYIVIRDMMPSSSIDSINMDNYKDDVRKVIEKSNDYYLRSFERHWGSIKDNYRAFIHYILKYRYEINWNREVLENYLPINIEDVLKKIPNDYSIKYKEQFIVPFIKEQTFKDFGIKMDQNTHTKLILESNGY